VLVFKADERQVAVIETDAVLIPAEAVAYLFVVEAVVLVVEVEVVDHVTAARIGIRAHHSRNAALEDGGCVGVHEEFQLMSVQHTINSPEVKNYETQMDCTGTGAGHADVKRGFAQYKPC
jgi:hypothetical protein